MNPSTQTSPDELLDTFKGRSLKSIVVFTIAVHAVILLGTSVPFLWKGVAGGPSKEASEQERVQAAVKEATASLRKIAEAHGLEPQALSSQLAGGAPKAQASAPIDAATPETSAPVPAESPAPAGEPKSAIEQEIEKVEEGPTVPPVPQEEEVDLFR